MTLNFNQFMLEINQTDDNDSEKYRKSLKRCFIIIIIGIRMSSEYI